MKLVEIKDVRVGQIYKIEFGFVIVKSLEETDDGILGFLINWNYGNNVNNSSSTTEFLGFDINKNKDYKLIGFLNITHTIQNNKLVELPRKEFEVDDILFNKETGNLEIINYINPNNEYFTYIPEDNNQSIYIYQTQELHKFFTKKGILGIDFEFINSKLVNKEQYVRKQKSK